MSRLARYLLWQLLPWFALALVGTVLVFLATQLVRVAPVFIGADAAAAELIGALGLLLVPVLGWALTPAFAVALFAVAARLGADGELTALDAAGLGRWRVIAGPALLAAVIVALSVWLWIDGGPRSQQALRGLALELAGRAILGRLEPGRLHQPSSGLTFFAAERAGGRYRGVLIEDARDPGRSLQVTARVATLRFDERAQVLELALEDGRIFIEGSTGRPPAALGFAAADLALPLAEEIDERLGFLPALMAVPSAQLRGPPPAGIAARDWGYALWRRIAGPIGFAALGLVALALALGGNWRRRGSAVAAAGALFLAYHLLGRFGEELMRGGRIGPIVAALGPAALVLLVAAALVAGAYLQPRVAAHRAVVRSRLSG